MVTIAEYRCRIGRFRQKSFDVDLTTVHIIGVVSFIGLLLFMAGIELNPGPGSTQVYNVQLLKYSSILKMY